MIFPMTPSMKVQKFKLREMAEELVHGSVGEKQEKAYVKRFLTMSSNGEVRALLLAQAV